MTVVAGVVAGLVSLMWVVSALAKATSPADTVHSVRAFGVPGRIALPVTGALLAGELGAAGLTLVPLTRIVGLVGSAVALVAFSIVMVRVIRSGREVSCNCFGTLTRDPVDNRSLVRNGVLLLVVLTALGLTVAFRPDSALPAVWTFAAAAGLTTIGALVVLSWVAARSMRLHGELAERIAALEAAASPAVSQVVVPESATLAHPRGWPTSLGHHLAGRPGPVLLVVLADSCGPCRTMISDDLDGWLSTDAELLVVVETSPADQPTYTVPGSRGPARAHVEPGWATTAGFLGTPAAVRIEPSGALLGLPVYGTGEVRQKVEEAVGAALSRRAVRS